MTGVDLLVYVGYALLIGSVAYGLFMMNKGGGDMETMSPSGLDDFNITQAKEGSVVPRFYGRVKLTGNIIWYGNLYTTPVVEEVDTGKGSEDVVTGYDYFLDVWQTLGRVSGTASIITTYIQGDEKEVEYDAQVFNDGQNGQYSDIPGEYANPLRGVVHNFYNGMYLGENVTYVPTVHYVMDQQFDSLCPLVYKNLSNGANPAAIIWDILTHAGASVGELNQTYFQAAADYWYNKGYGLNVIFNRRVKARDAVKQILSYVGGAFSFDNDNKLYITAFDPDDASSHTLRQDAGDFIKLKFTRRMWDKVNNEFVGTYKDSDNDYTDRTVGTYNPAVQRLVGVVKRQQVDLKAFRDVETASARIWEIMKESSYPYAECTAECPLKWSKVLVGQVITVYHDDYGIAGAEFRVMRKEVKSLDDQKITFTLRQKTESLYDANFITNPQTGWVNPSYLPENLHKAAVFELPFNPATGREVAWLLLAARKNQFEAGFYCYTSPTNSDYQNKGSFKTFSQYGQLSAAYGADTNEIDETGLTYTPYREDPEFDTVSLLAALRGDRIAIVDSEIMGFRTVTLLEGGDVRLTGVIRGMYGTTKAAHSLHADIWLTKLDSNVLLNETAASPYFKLVPYTHAGVFDIANVTYINKARTLKASQVPAPRIMATRSGSDITVTVQPVVLDGTGAGLQTVDVNDHALLSIGRLFYKDGAGGTEVETGSTEFTFNTSSAVNLYVRHEINGVTSTWAYLTINITDGDYLTEGKVPDAGTGLEHLRYGQQAWSRVIDKNFIRLNDDLLKVSGMQDVNLSGLADTNVLQWNGTSFVPVARGTLDFGRTTTSTTTTTTTTSTTTTT